MSQPNLPSLMTIFFTSIAPLCLTYLGPVLLRTELHEWVNIIILVLLYPFAFWFLTKKTFFPDISFQGIIISLIAAMLIMTMILQIAPEATLVKRLKKYFKEYGRKPFDTFAASSLVALSLCIGSVLTLAFIGPRGFLDLGEF